MANAWLVAGVTVTCPTGFSTDAVYATSPGSKRGFNATAPPSSSASSRPLRLASAEAIRDTVTV